MGLRPVNLSEVESKTSNIYEAVIVAAKKARLHNEEVKNEFNAMVASLNQGVEDEFDDKGNPDQLRFSIELDKKDKPQKKAMENLLAGEIDFRFKEEDAEPTT
jgi:DNA-directed RNA polymerase subunit K/omega